MKKGFTIIEVLAVMVIVGILCLIGGCTVLCIKGCNHVADHGVKNTATQIWEGPTSNTANVNTNIVE